MSNPSISIVGIGTVGFGDFSGSSTASIAHRALNAAFDDSGLTRSQVDGLVVHIGSPRGLDYDEMARLLNLELRFASQTWSHGRFCATVLQHAAMAIGAWLPEVKIRTASSGAARRSSHRANVRGAP